MKIFKTILIILGAIIGLILIITVFLPSSVHVERSIEINSPVSVPFNLVNNPRNWEKWSPWWDLDTNVVISYEGPESGVGAVYKWESNNPDLGSGTMTIEESIEFTKILSVIEFAPGMNVRSPWVFEEKDGVTKVTWMMDEELGFFWRWFGLAMESMIGPFYEKGLDRIKNISESMPKTGLETIEITQVPAQNILYISDECAVSEIKDRMEKTYGEIMAFMGKYKLEMAAMPLAITRKWDEKSWAFDAAIPVNSSDIKTEGRIKFGSSYAGKVVKAVQKGPYEQAVNSYQEIDDFIKKNKLEIAGILGNNI